MSLKRGATTNLNHDNWDKVEKDDDEEMCGYKMASKEVLKTRVIKTARRRNKIVGSEQKNRPAFGGFSGFNKTQPTSFDFLSNLTNDNKISTISPANNTENSPQPFSTNDMFSKISSGNIFTSSTPPKFTNPAIGKQSTPSLSMFGMPSSTATTLAFGIPASNVTSVFPASVTTSSTSTFGVPSSAALSSVFGAPSTTVSSVFGAPSSTTVPSFFGAPSTTASSVFGVPSTAVSSILSTPSTAAVSSVFGAPSSVAVSSVFGAPSTVSSVFGAPSTVSSVFGAPSTAGSSVFGTPSSTAVSSVFGTPSSTALPFVFGTPFTVSSTPAFSTPSSTTAPFTFGTPFTTSSTSAFSTPSSTTAPYVFRAAPTTTSSVFGAAPTTTSSVFGAAATTTTSVFGTAATTTSSVFGASSPVQVTSVFKAPSSSAVPSFFGTFTSKEETSVVGSTASTIAPSVFGTPVSTATKSDSTTNENPFKKQATSTSTTSNFDTKPEESTKVSSSIFGTAISNFNNNKSLVTASNSTPFQIKSSTNLTQPTNSPGTEVDKIDGSSLNSKKIQDKKIIYYSKLKGLNESVSEWIIKNVQDTPLCILTPIFKDYEGYLKEIQREYTDKKDEIGVNEENISKTTQNVSSVNVDKSPLNTKNTEPIPIVPISNTTKSIFGASTQNTTQSPNFSFGFTSTPGTNTTSSGFSFGVSSTQSTATTTSPFAISKATSDMNGKAPFSFGIEKPFNFASNIQVKSNTEKTSENADEDEDEPPKVEITPIVEENSVFDKRCKIFVKKDGNFVDKGIGTLYVKKIQDSMKYQLLVRAHTNLGNVLLNLILSSSIPTQRMGKNNVMLVCVPTPEAKPPPVPVLIRVKTSEEADDLLKTLDEYKV